MEAESNLDDRLLLVAKVKHELENLARFADREAQRTHTPKVVVSSRPNAPTCSLRKKVGCTQAWYRAMITGTQREPDGETVNKPGWQQGRVVKRLSQLSYTQLVLVRVQACLHCQGLVCIYW